MILQQCNVVWQQVTSSMQKVGPFELQNKNGEMLHLIEEIKTLDSK